VESLRAKYAAIRILRALRRTYASSTEWGCVEEGGGDITVYLQ